MCDPLHVPLPNLQSTRVLRSCQAYEAYQRLYVGRVDPERVVEWAVTGMLPKTKLGRAMARKLKVYRGAEHPHQAQQPQALPARKKES